MPITEEDIQRLRERVARIQFEVEIVTPAECPVEVPIEMGMRLYLKEIRGNKFVLVPIEQNAE